MDISISTGFNYDFSFSELLTLISQAGFSHVSLGGGDPDHSGYLHPAGQANIRRLTSAAGLKICSLHAPFMGLDISSPDPSTAQTALDAVKRALDGAAAIEAPVVIFHPFSPRTAKEGELDRRKAIMAEQVDKLLNHIGSAGVRLAVENMGVELADALVRDSLDRFQTPAYGLCYDTSHDNLTVAPLALLRAYGHRLLATHVSDNLGQTDDHMLALTGRIDWPGFIDVFSKLNYKGVFLLEPEMFASPQDRVEDFLAAAFAGGREIMLRAGLAEAD